MWKISVSPENLSSISNSPLSVYLISTCLSIGDTSLDNSSESSLTTSFSISKNDLHTLYTSCLVAAFLVQERSPILFIS